MERTNGKLLAVDKRGAGDAIIMVHGLGGTSNTWDPQAAALARSFTVIRVDLEGSGRSPATGPLSIDGYVDDLFALMDAQGIAAAHLVGHSMGTAVCQHAAVRAPARVKSLALFGPVTEPPDAGRQALRDRAAKARAEGMGPIAEAMVEGGTSAATKAAQPVVVALIRELVTRQDPEGFARTCEALSQARAADLGRVACPVLLVTGDEDGAAPPAKAKAMAAALKDVRTLVLPGCGHWTPLEKPAEVTASLINFYLSLAPSPAAATQAPATAPPAPAQARPRQVLLSNARLFVGDGREVVPDGAVWIEGEEIRWAGPTRDLRGVPDDVTRIDCGGKFVMPGMVETHAHLFYGGAKTPADNDLHSPAEEAFLTAIENAALMLRVGYTSACGFGALHRVDVALRNAINAGRVAGPRLLASGRGITPTSGLVDWHPSHWKVGMQGMALKADSPSDIRRAVREIRKEGADIVKIFLDGENMTPQSQPSDISYSLEEVMACGEEARARNVRVVTHSRSAEAVKMALKAGFFAIGHANYLDEEALDMMRQSSKPVFVGPAIAFEMGLYENGAAFGFDKARLDKMGYGAEIEMTKKSVRRLRAIGVRVVPGGDYGFGWTPHGTYAKDLQYFVDLFGYTPFDALLAATRDAGEMVGFGGGRVGTLEAGKLADLVVVDGDPTVDITVLQDRRKIVAVMKGGAFYHYALNGYGATKRMPGIGRDPESLETALTS